MLELDVGGCARKGSWMRKGLALCVSKPLRCGKDPGCARGCTVFVRLDIVTVFPQASKTTEKIIFAYERMHFEPRK